MNKLEQIHEMQLENNALLRQLLAKAENKSPEPQETDDYLEDVLPRSLQTRQEFEAFNQRLGRDRDFFSKMVSPSDWFHWNNCQMVLLLKVVY